jgi:phosphoglycerate kinase
MDAVGRRLAQLGGFPVVKLDGLVGTDVEGGIAAMEDGAVALLENTRFDPGETANDPDLAGELARLADRFVLDAFGSAHRAHATTVGVAALLPSAAGRLLEAEITAMERLLEHPAQPYVVVLGGAKISDKLPVMKNLLPLVDLLLVGGGMCFTVLAAAGYEVGASLVDEDMLDDVRELLSSTEGGKILLPADIVVADSFSADAAHRVVPGIALPSGTMGLDIGPETILQFGSVIEAAETVYWNGPMGVFEWEAFRAGTAGVADALAVSEGFTVIGGGDSAAAVRLLEREDDVSHLSSGGGAGLEMLQGRPLPGVEALRRWVVA